MFYDSSNGDNTIDMKIIEECNHEWKELQKVTVFDKCDDSCPKEVPNNHGHVGRTGILCICIQCEEKKVLGEDSNKINVINLI